MFRGKKWEDDLYSYLYLWFPMISSKSTKPTYNETDHDGLCLLRNAARFW